MKQGVDQFSVESTPVVDMKKGGSFSSKKDSGWDNEKTEVYLEEDGQTGSAYLVDSHGEHFPITAFPFVIGRGNECDLVLNGKGISRKHIEIVFQSGRFVVNDLDSLNGLKVNGYKVARVILEEGDSIRLGEIVLTFTSTKSELKNDSESNKDSKRKVLGKIEKDGSTDGEKPTNNSPFGNSSPYKKILSISISVLSVVVIGVAGYSYLSKSQDSVSGSIVVPPSPTTNPTVQNSSAHDAPASVTQSGVEGPGVVDKMPSSDEKYAAANNQVADGADSNSTSIPSNEVVGYEPPPSIAISEPIVDKKVNSPPKPSVKPKVVATPVKQNQKLIVPSAAHVAVISKSEQSVSKQNATISGNSIAALEQSYLKGEADSALNQLKLLASNTSLSPSAKASAQQHYSQLIVVYNAYTAGKQAFLEGDKKKAVESWEIFLNKEKSLFGKTRSVYANAVVSKLVDQFVAQGNDASRSGDHHVAYKLWKKALSFGDSVAARIAIDNVDQKSKQLYRQALRLEYVNTARAKELWQEVVKLVPPGNEYYTKASSKLAWYNKWGA